MPIDYLLRYRLSCQSCLMNSEKQKNDCLTAQFQKCSYVILFENDKNYIVPPYTITLLSLQFWLLLIYYYHYNKFFVFLCVKLCTKHVSHWYTKVIQLEQCFFQIIIGVNLAKFSRDSVVLNAINQSKSKHLNDR